MRGEKKKKKKDKYSRQKRETCTDERSEGMKTNVDSEKEGLEVNLGVQTYFEKMAAIMPRAGRK